MSSFSLISYNIHKGMSPLNRAVIMHKLARALEGLSPDVLCLQEVSGQNLKRTLSFNEYPDEAQHAWFGEFLGLSSSYGKNAEYAHGHHGNATLSRYPLDPKHNVNITVNRLERRGVLHSEITIDGQVVVVLNAHLNLLHRDRVKQYRAIGEYIATLDLDVPLVLAGDFNDCSKKSDEFFVPLGLTEVFTHFGKHPATFPAKLPLISLDRIYVKNLTVQSATVHTGTPWTTLSDHLPISATLSLEC